jgi:hypothetical protein
MTCVGWLTADLAAKIGSKRQQTARRKQLQELAANLDTNWLAVTSRLPIENCLKKRRQAQRQGSHRIRFDFLCDRRWEDLQTTSDQAVRHCDSCRQNVHYCDTIMDARQHAQQGHCVAVDLGIIRRDGDLQPVRYLMGRMSPQMLHEEEERTRPDPVSAARVERKQEQATRSRSSRRKRPLAAVRWEQGDQGRVRDGTFAGMEGVVREVLSAQGLIRVELTIFGRPVSVELEPWQVEPISG